MIKINKIGLFIFIIISVNNYLFADDLLLWNKLGSGVEIQNSQVGSNGIVSGNVEYGTVNLGKGAQLKDRSNAFIKFPSGCYNKTNGCFECWVAMSVFSSYPSFDGVIFETYNSLNSKFLSLTIQPNKICATLSGLNYFVMAKAVFDEAKWNTGDVLHIAVVYDINHTYDGDKTLSLFINGIEKAYSTSSIDELTAGELYIGKNPYANTEYFPGHVSNLKIWNYPKNTFSNFMY